MKLTDRQFITYGISCAMRDREGLLAAYANTTGFESAVAEIKSDLKRMKDLYKKRSGKEHT
jgi:hypothetical protein